MMPDEALGKGPYRLNRRQALPLLLAVVGGRAAAQSQAGILHVRVLAEDTGEITPCTIMLRDATGRVITRAASYAGGFRSSGDFREPLPPGRALLVVTRGFDYVAESHDLNVQPNETIELEIRLRRRSPLTKLGWVCGDNHVHMTHGQAKIVVDFDYIGLTARAEALDYLSVAQRWNLPVPTAAAAEAECRRVSTKDCLLTWNMEAPKNYFRGDVSHCLGHGWILGARPTDRAGRDVAAEISEMNAGDYQHEKTPAPNFDTHALIHSQGGIVSYTHPCRWWSGKWGGRGGYPVEEHKFLSNLAQELPFDTVAGPTYDTVDILMQTHEKEVNAQGEQLWYSLLNHAYRVAGTASSDASFDNVGHAVPGAVRVYTKIAGPKRISAVAEAMKRGANFVTSGPLLLLSVDGREPGDRIVAERTTRRTARIRAWASGVPEEHLTEIQLVRNGALLKRFPVSGRPAAFEGEYSWDEDHSGWIIARCLGRDPDRQIAITNPIYFETPGWKPPEPARATVRIRVTDAHSGRIVGGVCTVIEMIGREARNQFQREFRDGTLEIQTPATARLRVESPGYRAQTRSIFLDFPPILEANLNMKVEQILDWATFERMRKLLQQVQLDFPLEPV